jgi:hypothetical protein
MSDLLGEWAGCGTMRKAMRCRAAEAKHSAAPAHRSRSQRHAKPLQHAPWRMHGPSAVRKVLPH